MPFKYPSPIDRLIANTVVSTEHFYKDSACWEWIGTRIVNRDGRAYGALSIRIKGKVVKELAHRWVLREIKGRRLTKNSVGRHLCNNTLCAHPDHLVGGTQTSNIRQCVREGRHGNAYHSPVRDSL